MESSEAPPGESKTDAARSPTTKAQPALVENLRAGMGCLTVIAILIGVAVVCDAAWTRLRDGEWLLWRDCPFGSEKAGKHPPDGTSEWCQELSSEGSYVKHGRVREWYASGQLKDEGRFVHGKPQGRYWGWSSAGALEESGSFEDGQLEGVFLRFDESGAARSAELFKANVALRWTKCDPKARRPLQLRDAGEPQSPAEREAATFAAASEDVKAWAIAMCVKRAPKAR